MKKSTVLFLVLLLSCGSDGNNGSFPEGPDDGTVEIDQAVLDDLQLTHFNFFWELTNPDNGLVPDRASPANNTAMCSIAATGFGLTAYIVGAERGFITRVQAAERTLTTLRFFANAPQSSDPANATGYRGFFYHFLNRGDGLRTGTSELSTIDTALLMGGVLAAQTYFDGDGQTETEIRELADRLFLAVDWKWAMNGHDRMTMGWTPESGFLSYLWSGYNEAMILYIMALGTGEQSKRVDASVWDNWTATYRWETFHNFEMVNFSPLFGHQYSHLWIDFNGIKDDYTRSVGIDYFINSQRAANANRAYCIANPSGYKGYGENFWGLTACDGPGAGEYGKWEYYARGASALSVEDDGTLAPTAAGGSFPFTPTQSYAALVAMQNYKGGALYTKYGFKDSFNPSEDWIDDWWLGIDQGPILIMIENYRTGLIWDLMKKNKYIVDGLRAAGFSGGWLG
ncbi:MAG: hypothetical protein LUF87_08125 [Alistipes sp.]|nr:hypothetical protein [Alistipes sp.]